jgi:hypothetical protein
MVSSGEQVTAVMRMPAPLTCVLVLTDRWLIGVSWELFFELRMKKVTAASNLAGNNWITPTNSALLDKLTNFSASQDTLHVLWNPKVLIKDMSLVHCMTQFFINKHWSPFVTCFLNNKPKAKLTHGSNPLTTRNTTKNNCTCIISHAQSTTAPPPNAFLSRIHWLVVTNRKVSAFSSSTCFQGHIQTPQSVSVLLQ